MTDAFEGRAIVITGAASGIGEGIAGAAAARGMRIVLADIAEDRLQRVAEGLRRSGAEVETAATDVRDPDALERVAELAYRRFGEVRILVNNAGIEATGYSWEAPAAEWGNVIAVNLLGVYHGVRAFVPRMRAQAGAASIVNLSSVAALTSGPPLQSAYNASKHGVQSLTESLHVDLRESGSAISVHVVLPGPVATRIFLDADADSNGSPGETARAFYAELVGRSGLSGREAGEIVLDGVAAGRFWISTHPEMSALAIEIRTRMLAEQTPPESVLAAAAVPPG